MPNINVRSFQVEPGAAPRPVEGGAAAYEQEGRHVEAAYAKAGSEIGGAVAEVGGQYVKHEQNLDAVDQANYFAHKQEAITQRLAAAKLTNDPTDPNYLDPHDPQAVTKLLDKLDENDTDFQANVRTVNGQTAFGKQNAEFRANAFRQATVDQAELAAKDITNKFNDTVQTSMANVYLDPMQADISMAHIESMRSLLPAGADGEINRAKQEIAKSAATALIDKSKDPLKAVKFAEGKWGDQLGSAMPALQDHAVAMDRAARQDAQYAHTLLRERQQEASEARANQYIESWAKNGGQPPANYGRDIMSDQTLKPSEKASLLAFGNRAGEDAVPNNPNLVSDLMKRMSLPDTDPRAVTPGSLREVAVLPGGLSKSDYDFVSRVLQDPDKNARSIKTQAFSASDALIAATLNPKNGFNIGTSPGALAEANAKLGLSQALSDGEKKGYSWADMLLPSGAHYILTDKFFAHYKHGNSGNVSALVGPNQPAKAGPKPSLDDIFQGK